MRRVWLPFQKRPQAVLGATAPPTASRELGPGSPGACGGRLSRSGRRRVPRVRGAPCAWDRGVCDLRCLSTNIHMMSGKDGYHMYNLHLCVCTSAAAPILAYLVLRVHP